MDNPTETTLELSSGNIYRVLFSMLGMIRAEEEYGYNIGGVEMDPEKKPEAVEKPSRGIMRAMLEDVWLGILTFEMISFEELAMQIQTQDDMRAVGKAYAHVQKYQAPKKNGEAKGDKKKSLSTI